MADRSLISRFLGPSILAAATVAVSIYALWPRSPHPAEPHGIVIVPGAAPRLPNTVAPPGRAHDTAIASSTAGVSVLETATADDTGPGSAAVRDASGSVVRLLVGSRLGGGAVLTNVSDDSATFQSAGRTVTLPVTNKAPAAVSYRSARHRD